MKILRIPYLDATAARAISALPVAISRKCPPPYRLCSTLRRDILDGENVNQTVANVTAYFLFHYDVALPPHHAHTHTHHYYILELLNYYRIISLTR